MSPLCASYLLRQPKATSCTGPYERHFCAARCCSVVVAYLMLKFGWSLANTMNFMITAHPDMTIQSYFIRQLKAYAKRFASFELVLVIFAAS